MLLRFIIRINKSQGQTLGGVCVFMTEPDFARGQLHVTMSTTRNKHGLKIFVAGAANQGKRYS